jgi:hypothetical protein
MVAWCCYITGVRLDVLNVFIEMSLTTATASWHCLLYTYPCEWPCPNRGTYLLIRRKWYLRLIIAYIWPEFLTATAGKSKAFILYIKDN